MSNRNMSKKTAFLVQSAVIAALYAVLTLLLAPISYGLMQVRISEALCVLPLYTPAGVPGLFLGCLLANLLGGMGIYDVVFGSLTTLLAAACTRLLRKHSRYLAPLPTVLFNALIIGGMMAFLFDVGESFALCALYIGVGEAIACYALGIPLTFMLEKSRVFKEK